VSRAARVGVLVVGGALALAALAGCTDDPADAPPTSAATASARPITSDEANRLAVARFTVWDQRWTDVDLRVPVVGDVLHLVGRADLREHEAYARVTSREGDALLQWDLTGKAVLGVAAGVGVPTPAPTAAWRTAAMDGDDPLDAALLLTLNLASDRPENPVLLQQNGARWVGSGSVDGTAVDVFTAPAGGAEAEASASTTSSPRSAQDNPLVRYAVDARGYLREVTADTGRSEPLVVTLAPSDDTTPIELVPGLVG